MSTLLSSVVCTYVDDGVLLPEPTLDADESIVCWEGVHIALVCCGILALIVYFGAAVSGTLELLCHKPYADRRRDNIRYDWHYVKASFQVKCFIAAGVAFFGKKDTDDDQRFIFFGMLVLGNGFLLATHIYRRPCTIDAVNYVRLLMLVESCWGVICAGVALLINDTEDPTTYIIFDVGFVVIIGIFAVAFIKRIRREKQEGGSDTADMMQNRPSRLAALLLPGTPPNSGDDREVEGEEEEEEAAGAEPQESSDDAPRQPDEAWPSLQNSGSS